MVAALDDDTDYLRAIGAKIARTTSTLNPVDIANFETIMDIANVGIAVKALEGAEFPFKFTIERNHGLVKDQVMSLFRLSAGRLLNNLLIDFENSIFTDTKTKITFWVGDQGIDDDKFTRYEKLFLKSASFWLERCYNAAVYQGYLRKNDKVFITGGALNRYYNRCLTAKTPWQGSIGDVDFWFMEDDDAASFRERWGEGSDKTEENDIIHYKGQKGVYTTSQGLDPLYAMKFQFIHFTEFDPEKMSEVFDFEHCLPFWVSDEKTLYVDPAHFRYIKHKLLVPCPNGAKIIESRLRKYQEQGFEKIKLPPPFGSSSTQYADIEWYIDNILVKAKDG